MQSSWLTRAPKKTRRQAPMCRVSFALPEGQPEPAPEALQLAGDRVAGHVLAECDLLLGQVLDEPEPGHVDLLDATRNDLQALAEGARLLGRGTVRGEPLAQHLLGVIPRPAQVGSGPPMADAGARGVGRRIDG